MSEATEQVVDATVVKDEPNMTSLAVRDQGALVQPAGSMGDIQAAFDGYQELCKSLLDSSDFQNIAGKTFKKKSAWRKLGVAFGVTHSLVDRVIERDDKGNVLRAEFVYKAVAPNGRSQDGWGSCDLYEKCCAPGCRKGGNHTHCRPDCPGSIHFAHANHDIPATAETRAKNRASADLFGMGEVSAEEIVSPGESAPSTGDWSAPTGLSEHNCPSCGSPVFDNRDTATGKQPVWRCSNKNCKGGSKGFGWASWNKDEFSKDEGEPRPQADTATDPASSTHSPDAAPPVSEHEGGVAAGPPAVTPPSSVDGAVYAQLLIDAIEKNKDIGFADVARTAAFLAANFSPVPSLTKVGDIDTLVDSHPDFLKALCDKLGLTQPAQQVIA